MPLEYVLYGQFSVKSDGFIFGVVVLEIISGQKNDFQNRESTEHLSSYVSFLNIFTYTFNNSIRIYITVTINDMVTSGVEKLGKWKVVGCDRYHFKEWK